LDHRRWATVFERQIHCKSRVSPSVNICRHRVTLGSYVIWLADTNYRIDLDNSLVRELAESDELDALMGADQLKKAMESVVAFPDYDEGPLLFRPTYRYDLYSESYDTSEKMRAPAWTGERHISTKLKICHSRLKRSYSLPRPRLRPNGLQPCGAKNI